MATGKSGKYLCLSNNGWAAAAAPSNNNEFENSPLGRYVLPVMEIVEIVGSQKAFGIHQNFSLNSVIKVLWQEGEKGVAEEE